MGKPSNPHRNLNYAQQVHKNKKKAIIEKIKLKQQKKKLLSDYQVPEYLKDIFEENQSVNQIDIETIDENKKKNLIIDNEDLKEENETSSSRRDSSSGNKQEPTAKRSYQRPNPFVKAVKKRKFEQEIKEKEQIVKTVERETKEMERNAYYQQRDKQRRSMLKRTDRGQPVMKNVIHNLLGKIKKAGK